MPVAPSTPDSESGLTIETMEQQQQSVTSSKPQEYGWSAFRSPSSHTLPTPPPSSSVSEGATSGSNSPQRRSNQGQSTSLIGLDFSKIFQRRQTPTPPDSEASTTASSRSSSNNSPTEDTDSDAVAREAFINDVRAAGLSEDAAFKHTLCMLELALIKPNNFAPVLPGLWRSSFPAPANIKLLKTLGLKTIVTLVNTPCSEPYTEFMQQAGVNHINLHVKANKVASDVTNPASQAEMRLVLSTILDRANYPLLVHCNKGKHRTGTTIACLRKIMGWDHRAIINEYRHYAGAKYRELDEEFLDLFDVEALRELALENSFIANVQASSTWTTGDEDDERPEMDLRFPEDGDRPAIKKEAWRKSLPVHHAPATTPAIGASAS